MPENSNINANRLRLRESNPFANGTVIQFPDGESVLLSKNFKWPGSEGDKIHSLEKGQDIDWLAWTYYRDIVDNPDWWWWIIASANDGISNPLDLEHLVGTDLVIPDILTFRLLNRGNEDSILSS